MDFFFLVKLLIVIVFLVMFLRGSKVVWGVGLLTVSSAFLLDTVLGTFGRQELLDRLGFYYYVLSGALFGGGAIWLWGLLRPYLAADGTISPEAGTGRHEEGVGPRKVVGRAATDTEKQQLFEKIHTRLGPDDIRDLAFDLELNENDLFAPQREITKSIHRIIYLAEKEDKMEALSLAIERILTPVPPEKLPRREKLNAHSPPTILRHYLLANFSQRDLAQVMEELGIDGEQLEKHNKKETVRELLLYLQRRDRMGELIAIVKAHEPGQDGE